MARQDGLLFEERATSRSDDGQAESVADWNWVPNSVKIFPFLSLIITTTLSFLLAASVNQ
jgi:hypothetical protein